MPPLKIILEEYNDQWPLIFDKLKSIYQAHLGNLVLDIQHVGSTSVPGLVSKPVLDIDLMIDPKSQMDPIILELERLGYEYQGNLGITDRFAFRRSSDQVPNNGSNNLWMKHNLYVCPMDSISLKNHLALRDFLRTHESMAQEYGRLKRKLAEQFPYSMDSYIEGKTDFILQILKNMEFDNQEIQTIRLDNQSGL